MTAQKATRILQAATRTLNLAVAKTQGQIASVSGSTIIIETEYGNVTIDDQGHVIIDRTDRQLIQDSQSVRKSMPAMWGRPTSDSSCPTCGRSF